MTAALAEPVAGSRAQWRLNPVIAFWVAGILIYGAAAVNFSTGHFLDQTPRDIWQHLAALRALIADPFNPANPFVPGTEGSRHFHPYWVSLALIARVMGWTEWQAMALGGFVTAGVLLAGIYAFGRAFYRSPWGPLALFAAMVLSWSFPISHTGYHSMGTLIEGIGYPAPLLIGLSLLLWALVIHALQQPRLAWVIIPLTALMFATHQLGAGMGFITAACFIALEPRVPLSNRIAVAAAVGGGLLLSMAWPYHNPLLTVARTGNASWTGGMDFYRPAMLALAFVPSAAGLLGFFGAGFAERARPALAAFLIFAGVFAIGWFGPMIATRFVMPAILMLHVGVGALLLSLASKWSGSSSARQLTVFGFVLACVAVQLTYSAAYLTREARKFRTLGSAHAAAQDITRDIPDQSPVGAYDMAAWPIVATGQRVFSVPWPEPGIANLGGRQALTEQLFDPKLSRAERLSLARRLGIRHLVMDRRGPLRRDMPEGLVRVLSEQSVRQSQAGNFLRFDLY